MSELINNYIAEGKLEYALECCIKEKHYNLGLLLATIWKENSSALLSKYDKLLKLTKKYRVLLTWSFSDSKTLCDLWNKMSKGNYTWNNIEIVWDEPADYYVIINQPYSDKEFPPDRTILFRMEPHMETSLWWNEKWRNPDRNQFLFAGFHDIHYNNNEWHLSKTYNQLMYDDIVKNQEICNVLSTVLSGKYEAPGHKKRVDFMKFVESKGGINVHIYGSPVHNWYNYKGSLPSHEKDNAMFPYKYTFNVENYSINGYYTEKIIDGILSECLTFYSGCPDISKYIDERAYVWLNLENFEEDYNKIKQAIDEDWWSQRIEVIRNERKKILNEKQFFPRLESIITNHIIG